MHPFHQIIRTPRNLTLAAPMTSSPLKKTVTALKKDGQSKPGLLRYVITEVMTYNTPCKRIKYIKCSES
jgi:hypothetical protein